MFIDAVELTEEGLRKKMTELGASEHDIEVALKHARDMEEEPTPKNDT